MHAERVDPEVVGQLGVAGGDVPGDALVEAERAEQPERGGQPLLAVQALVVDRGRTSAGSPCTIARAAGVLAAIWRRPGLSGPPVDSKYAGMPGAAATLGSCASPRSTSGRTPSTSSSPTCTPDGTSSRSSREKEMLRLGDVVSREGLITAEAAPTSRSRPCAASGCSPRPPARPRSCACATSAIRSRGERRRDRRPHRGRGRRRRRGDQRARARPS